MHETATREDTDDSMMSYMLAQKMVPVNPVVLKNHERIQVRVYINKLLNKITSDISCDLLNVWCLYIALLFASVRTYGFGVHS